MNTNNPFTKEDLLKSGKKLGANEGKGANSRGEAAILVATYAAHGAIQADKYLDGSGAEVDDIREFWSVYQEGRKAQAVDTDRPVTDEGKDAAQRVSEIRQAAKVGALPHIDGVEVLNRTRTKAQTMPEYKKGTYGAIINAARAQLKKFKAGDTSALSDSEIDEVLNPQGKEKDTSEKSRLQAQLKGLNKVREGSDEIPGYSSPQLDTAIAAIENRLAEITGLENAQKAQASVESAIEAGDLDLDQLAALLQSKGLVLNRAA